MVRIFSPQLYDFDIRDNKGIFEALCIILRLDNSNMSTCMSEISEWYKGNLYNYTDEVNDLVCELTSIKDYGHPGLFSLQKQGVNVVAKLKEAA